MTHKIIKKRIRYPKYCPLRTAKAIPHTDGYFQWVCYENDEINCKNECIFPLNCPLEDEE